MLKEGSSKTFHDYAKQLNETMQSPYESVLFSSYPSSPFERMAFKAVPIQTRLLSEGKVKHKALKKLVHLGYSI